MISIDRIEETLAVLETDTGMKEIPREELPEEAREGDLLARTETGYRILSEETQARRAAVAKRQHQITQKKNLSAAPIFLKAAQKDYLWGGTRLATQLRKRGEPAPERLAELWELSTHPAGICQIVGETRTLADVLPKPLNVLVKLIDAAEDLSIQVHPDDTYAKKIHHSLGKTEMWYILDAAPDAHIFYGVQRPLTREELSSHLSARTLPEVLRRVSVKLGDVYQIPAGTIHAIGGGVLLAEIQESSDITYRLYDYDRRDDAGNFRPLHIPQAMETARLTPNEMSSPVETRTFGDGGIMKILDDTRFHVRLFRPERATYTISRENLGFCHLLVLAGTGEIEVEGISYPVRTGDSVFLPAGAYLFRGTGVLLETSQIGTI